MIGDVMGSATAVGFVMALFLAVVFITDGGGSFHPGPAECGGSIGFVGGAPLVKYEAYVLKYFRTSIKKCSVVSSFF